MSTRIISSDCPKISTWLNMPIGRFQICHAAITGVISKTTLRANPFDKMQVTKAAKIKMKAVGKVPTIILCPALIGLQDNLLDQSLYRHSSFQGVLLLVLKIWQRI